MAERMGAGQIMVILDEAECLGIVQALMWARSNMAPVPEREDELLIWAEHLQSTVR